VVGGDSESVHQEDAGGCRAAKEGMNCKRERIPRRHARDRGPAVGVHRHWEVYRGPNSVAISNTPLPPPLVHHKTSKAKGNLGVNREKRDGESGRNGR
jgi:hypothetical protein